MTEVLSQDEIDQLLTAISSGEVSTEEPIAQVDQRKIKIYDFKRPDKFSKDQIRTVSIMHETFARQTTTALSSQLRSLAHVHVASVDQLTYEEFIRSIPNPTTIAVINMDPLKGSAILEIDPAVTFSIIDRLFGGQGEGAKFTRELTDIEASVIEGIIVRILGNLREAWATVIDLRPRLGQIETNPQFAQIVPPSEMVVLVTLETKVGEVEGMMNFCIPYLTIEPIIPKLSAQYVYSSMRRGTTTENLSLLRDRLGRDRDRAGRGSRLDRHHDAGRAAAAGGGHHPAAECPCIRPDDAEDRGPPEVRLPPRCRREQDCRAGAEEARGHRAGGIRRARRG